MDFSYLTVLPRGRQIWDYAVFPEEEFNARGAAVDQLLDKLGLDGFIVYSDALSRRYVSYLTNYCNSVSWSCSVSLLMKGCAPIVVSSMAPRDIEYNLKSLAPGIELNAVGLGMLSNHRVAPKAMEYMQQHELTGKKWGGVNVGALNDEGQAAIYGAFPELKDYTADFDTLLSVKSGSEQFAISQATALAQKAVTDYLRMAVPGTNEREIAARIDRHFRIFGVDNIAILVSAGKDSNVSLHQPRDYVIQEGDTVSAHVDILYLHYNGVYGASLYRGKPDADRAQYYAAVEQEYASILDKLAQGAAISTVNAKGNGYVQAAGIGADTSEAPLDSALACGSTFTLTLCRENPSFGGVFLADTFLYESGKIRSIGSPGVNKVFHHA